MRANKVTEDDRVLVFLSILGGHTYEVLRSLSAPDLPESKTYAALVSLLIAHYEPKPIVIAERSLANLSVSFLLTRNLL